MAARKKARAKETERPRCICGALASVWLDYDRKVWRTGSCVKCQETTMEAELAPGGALRFIDDHEMEYETIEVDEAWCAVAEYTGRARLMTIDGEKYFVAIFKVAMEDGSYEWLGQPVPWEEP